MSIHVVAQMMRQGSRREGGSLCTCMVSSVLVHWTHTFASSIARCLLLPPPALSRHLCHSGLWMSMRAVAQMMRQGRGRGSRWHHMHVHGFKCVCALRMRVCQTVQCASCSLPLPHLINWCQCLGGTDGEIGQGMGEGGNMCTCVAIECVGALRMDVRQTVQDAGCLLAPSSCFVPSFVPLRDVDVHPCCGTCDETGQGEGGSSMCVCTCGYQWEC